MAINIELLSNFSSVVEKMARRSKIEKPNTHFWLFNSLILTFGILVNEAHAVEPNKSLKLQNEVHFLRFSKVIICDLTAVFFETGAMLTPTKSRNGTNCGSGGSFQSYITHS